MSSFLYAENMNFITPAVVSQPLPGSGGWWWGGYYTQNDW